MAIAWKYTLSIACVLACGGLVVATAQQKAPSAPSATSAKALTREQFKALPADAMIEVDGKSTTKSAFVARNTKALADAARQVTQFRAEAKAKSAARIKVLHDQRAAALADANKKADAEANKRIAAEAAKLGPDGAARQKQAADLLAKAAKAEPLEQAQLQAKAATLLEPPAAKK